MFTLELPNTQTLVLFTRSDPRSRAAQNGQIFLIVISHYIGSLVLRCSPRNDPVPLLGMSALQSETTRVHNISFQNIDGRAQRDNLLEVFATRSLNRTLPRSQRLLPPCLAYLDRLIVSVQKSPSFTLHESRVLPYFGVHYPD